MEYILKHNGATAKVEELGGEIVSYRDEQGVEYVWTGDAAYWSGHAPVLFPVVGALKDDCVSIGGESYHMAKHGFARKSQFKVEHISEDSVCFLLKDSELTRKQYPFSFELRIKHTLTEKGFCTEYIVKNSSPNAMPFCIGGHAGFCCPIEPDGQFEDYDVIFEKRETQAALYTDAQSILHSQNRMDCLQNETVLPLSYDLFQKDVIIFDAVNSTYVTLQNRSTGKGIRFDFSGFKALGIWTPPGKQAPFICLEPWVGLPAMADETGNMEDKPYVKTLMPNEVFSVAYTMEVKA